MPRKNNQSWSKQDEREHISSRMEWWSAQVFLQTSASKQKEYWVLKTTFTQWNKKKNQPGSLLNMVLYDPLKKIYYTYHNQNDFKKLEANQDTFEINYEDSYLKGKFPHYVQYLNDTKNDIQLKLTFNAETAPHWIAQDITNGWLPLGLGHYRYGFIPKLTVNADMTFKKNTSALKGIGYYEHVWGNLWYRSPLTGFRESRKTISIYSKLIRWWMHHHTIKIPNKICLMSENNPFGYDWSWAVLDNGWSLFYGNILFWLTEGAAPGIVILCKEDNTYVTFDTVYFSYNRVKKSAHYDFYYPTDFSIKAKKGVEELTLQFQMRSNVREYISKFPKPTFWKAFVICEGHGETKGTYHDGSHKQTLKGICKIEPQRQVSILGHNSLDLYIQKSPKRLGIDFSMDSQYLKKKIDGKLHLRPKPKLKIKMQKK